MKWYDFKTHKPEDNSLCLIQYKGATGLMKYSSAYFFKKFNLVHYYYWNPRTKILKWSYIEEPE